MSNAHLVTGYAGEEHVTSSDMGSYNAAIMGSGEYVLERGNMLSIDVISNNIVRLHDGDMMMQGRHVRIEEGAFIDLTIENGEQGKKRNDLIVARYSRNASTDIEAVEIAVLKGVAADNNPEDPAHTVGDIIEQHDLLHEMLLYRIPIDGINVQMPVRLFDTLPTLGTQYEILKGKIDAAVEEVTKGGILDTKEEIEGNTQTGKIAGALVMKEVLIDIKDTKKSVSDGKSAIASAITEKGVGTAADATFAVMAANIRTVADNKYNAGYNNGVAYADGRSNPSSTNYKTGYNAGVNATKKGTATAGKVLTGYTFTNGTDVNIPGTMPNKGSLNWSGSNTTKSVAAGYYSGGTLDSRPSYNNGYAAGKTAPGVIAGVGWHFTRNAAGGGGGRGASGLLYWDNSDNTLKISKAGRYKINGGAAADYQAGAVAFRPTTPDWDSTNQSTTTLYYA